MLRIAPGVEAHTPRVHSDRAGRYKIQFLWPPVQALETGKRVLKSELLTLKGIHCHIGSQILKQILLLLQPEIMIDFIAQMYKKTGVSYWRTEPGRRFQASTIAREIHQKQ